MQWCHGPGSDLATSGLAWSDENEPLLWRVPRGLIDMLPAGVATQGRFPAGAQLALQSNTTTLYLRIRHEGSSATALDLYVDGQFQQTVPVGTDPVVEVTCPIAAEQAMRHLEITLPLRHELQIDAWAVDAQAITSPPVDEVDGPPLVLYGSSVAQGIGATRPGLSYATQLSRLLQRPLVNLGFGGAGKAEPEVVDLVRQIETCCYLLDLGKSYGRQDAGAFLRMLSTLRGAHPQTPVICITPIFSTREAIEPDYAELSRHTRRVVRQACEQIGDSLVHIIEGETLLSSAEGALLSDDGVHPSDEGHTVIARRLQPHLLRSLEL